MRRLPWIASLVVLVGGGIGLAVRAGLSERDVPARCPSGLVDRGPRCCAPGQSEEGGRCVGPVEHCPSHLMRTDSGCVARAHRVRISAGTVDIGPDDWQSADLPPKSEHVSAFAIDAHEVTYARWKGCVAAGACASRQGEVGRPVTGVIAREAEAFCRHAGGRLPESAELWRAARGDAGRRFPWGPTGLVCRRATYGIDDGPCARGARGPELAGARPDGRTPEGVYDLAGNVAELAREPSGAYVARGGSYRSRVAREITIVAVVPARPSDDVGFRCAYETRAP